MRRLRPLLISWRAAALALLLLAVQALGLAHRIAHGPVLPALVQASGTVDQSDSDIWGHAPAARPAALAEQGQQGHIHDHPHDRTRDSDTSAECRLFDQLLGHADVLLAAVLPLPLPTPAVQQLARANLATGRAAAVPYQARAPPLA